MGSPFAAAMRSADRVIDRVVGEFFLVAPVADPAADDDGGSVNGPRRLDTHRAGLRVRMTLQEAGEAFFPTSRGKAANTAQQRVGADIVLSVLGENLPWRPQAGDFFTQEDTGRVFRAGVPKPDDAGRIWIPVTEELDDG